MLSVGPTDAVGQN